MSKAEAKTQLIKNFNSNNLKQKLYKFRPLADDNDFDRLKGILETGEFWCAKFSEFNDPREGGFTTIKAENIEEIYGEKESYRICSFSAKRAFSNPLMWSYYANGFKGVALEIKARDSEVKKITYAENIPDLEAMSNGQKTIIILTTKLRPWKHECEYRFLKKTSDGKNMFKIGEITAIYFGDPYDGAYNKDQIYERSEILKRYKEAKSRMVDYVKANQKLKHLRLYSVKIAGCSVVKAEDLKKKGVE